MHGVSSDGIFKQVNELAGHLHKNVLRMLYASRTNNGSWWVAVAGGFDRVVCKAAVSAERKLREKADRTWGALHSTHLAHPLTAPLGFPPGTFLDEPCVPSGGDANTLCQIAPKSLADLSASSTHVSARILFDLSDLAHGCQVATPHGVCEVAGSEHRSDCTATWHRGEYSKLRWEMRDIREHTWHVTTFWE